MDKHTRYIVQQVPLTEAEVRQRKASDLSYARARIAHREEQLAEAKDYLKIIRERPLETVREGYLALEPGDPGYDEAPDHPNFMAYAGDFKWINIPRD